MTESSLKHISKYYANIGLHKIGSQVYQHKRRISSHRRCPPRSVRISTLTRAIVESVPFFSHSDSSAPVPASKVLPPLPGMRATPNGTVGGASTAAASAGGATSGLKQSSATVLQRVDEQYRYSLEAVHLWESQCCWHGEC
jgi:hypothetical protein